MPFTPPAIMAPSPRPSYAQTHRHTSQCNTNAHMCLHRHTDTHTHTQTHLNAIPTFTLCRVLFAQTLLPPPVAFKADVQNSDSSGDLAACMGKPILQSTVVTVVGIWLAAYPYTHTPYNSDSSRDTHIPTLQSSSRDLGGCIPIYPYSKVVVEILVAAYPCAHAALHPGVSRSLRRKSSVKTPLSTTILTHRAHTAIANLATSKYHLEIFQNTLKDENIIWKYFEILCRVKISSGNILKNFAGYHLEIF